MKKNSRLTDTKMKYFDILDSYGKDDNMFPPLTDAQLAVNLLCEYLLGEDYLKFTDKRDNKTILYGFKNSEKLEKVLNTINEYRLN